MAVLNKIPSSEKISFKEKFVERYSKLTDWNEFKKYSLYFLRKSIRVNTLKTTAEILKKRISKDWVLEQIPWCKEGFWATHKKGRLDIGNTVEHAIGYYYVQEAASMIPPVILNPKPGELVLDLCSAPGGKSRIILGYLRADFPSLNVTLVMSMKLNLAKSRIRRRK